MRNRILLFTCAVIFSLSAILLPQSRISADTATLNPEHVAFFKTFNVFPAELANANDKFTRGEMAAVAANILRYRGDPLTKTSKNIIDIADHKYADEIRMIVERGLMTGDETLGGIWEFRPDDVMLTIDVVKVLVDMLGYAPLAQARGGYPLGYLDAARSISLISSLSLDTETNIGTAVKLVYTALHTTVPKYSVTGDRIGLQNNDGEAYIEKYWDLLWAEGILKSNSIINIDGTALVQSGWIKIDDNIYRSELLFENMDYLGQHVRFYIDNTNGDKNTIAAMYPLNSKNKKVILEAKDVMNFNDFLSISAVNQNGRETKHNISKNASVYYNFEYLGPADMAATVQRGYVFDALKKGKTTDVTLVDNDGNSTFDFVWIREYENIVVEDFLPAEFKITEKYAGKIEMEDAFDNNNIFIWDGFGGLFDMKKIEKNIVLSLAINKDVNDEVIGVVGYGSSSFINGMIKETSEEGVLVDGEYYLPTSEYIAQVEALSSKVKKLDVGMDTTFILNKFNMIAAINIVDITEENPTEIAFLSKISQSAGISATVSGMFHTTDGECVTLEFDNRIIINGNSVTGTNMFTALSRYGQQQKGLVYRLVKYKVMNNKVREIDIYAYGKKDKTSTEFDEYSKWGALTIEEERNDDLYPFKVMRNGDELPDTVYKASTIGKQVGLTGETVIFAVPSIEASKDVNAATDPGITPDVSKIEDDDIYTLKLSNLQGDRVFGEPSLNASASASRSPNKMQMAFYDVDDTNFAGVAVRYYYYTPGAKTMPDNPNLDSDYLVVEKIAQGKNKDEVDILVLYGTQKGEVKRIATVEITNKSSQWGDFPGLKYFLQDAKGVSKQANDIRPGDAVLIAYNSKGEAINFIVAARAGEKEDESWLTSDVPTATSTLTWSAIAVGRGNQFLAVNYGEIKKFSGTRLIVSEIDGKDRVYLLPSNAVVTIFDRSTKKVSKGTITDLEIGDDVCIRQYYSSIRELVCYR